MKITFLNTLYYPYSVGGAERVVQLLTERLAEQGHDVMVITLDKPKESPKQEVINRVHIYRVPLKNSYWPFSDVYVRPKIWRRALWHYRDRFNRTMGEAVNEILQQKRPDLLHTNNLGGFSVSVWAVAKSLSIPLVHTLHDYSLICPRNMFRNGSNCNRQCRVCWGYSEIKQRTSKVVDTVVGVSRFILERHLTLGYFPKAYQVVVHNPVIIPNARRNHIQKQRAKICIGYLGRLAPNKGIKELLHAVKSLSGESAVELIVAGQGEASYEEMLKKESAGLPVTFLGHVPPERLFQQIDLLIVPSLWQEPFSLAIIEAYSSGIPVVGASRGGIPEIIDQNRTGWLYDPDIKDDLRNILARIGQDKEHLELMKPLAINRAEDFSVANCVKQYEELYYMVTHKGG